MFSSAAPAAAGGGGVVIIIIVVVVAITISAFLHRGRGRWRRGQGGRRQKAVGKRAGQGRKRCVETIGWRWRWRWCKMGRRAGVLYQRGWWGWWRRQCILICGGSTVGHGIFERRRRTQALWPLSSPARWGCIGLLLVGRMMAVERLAVGVLVVGLLLMGLLGAGMLLSQIGKFFFGLRSGNCRMLDQWVYRSLEALDKRLHRGFHAFHICR